MKAASTHADRRVISPIRAPFRRERDVVERRSSDEVDGAVDGGGDGSGSRPIRSVDDGRLASDDERRGRWCHRGGPACRAPWRGSSCGRPAAPTLGARSSTSTSITATVPGRSPSGTASTRISRSYAVEQLVGQVHAADAVVGDPRAGAAPSRSASRRATSTPKPSSPKKMLPIPATSTFIRRPRRRSTSSGRKNR